MKTIFCPGCARELNLFLGEALEGVDDDLFVEA